MSIVFPRKQKNGRFVKIENFTRGTKQSAVMSHRSSGPRSDIRKQHAYGQAKYGTTDSRWPKEETYFPPIDARMPVPRASKNVTGRLGLPSSPGKPMRALSSDDRLIDSGRTTPHGRASPSKDGGKSHGQKQRSPTPKTPSSTQRSRSHDPNTAHSGHRRSSSMSKEHLSYKGPPLYNGTSASSRHQSSAIWNGSGCDHIAHRTAYEATKYSSLTGDPTRDVKESNLRNSLAQSTLKSCTSRHAATSTNGPNVPAATASGGGHRTQFDASVGTQHRTYDTTPSLPLANNVNNNASTSGSTTAALSLSAPRSSSNGEHSRPDAFSPPLLRVSPDLLVGEGLSGGGGCHGKLNDTEGRSNSKYTPETTYVSGHPGARHAPSSPPYQVGGLLRGLLPMLCCITCNGVCMNMCACIFVYVH